MNQALRPTTPFSADFEPITEVDEVQEKLQDEEEGYAYIARTGAWEKLKEYIAQLEGELDALVHQAMESGLGFEEIGQRATVKELAKGYLNKVIDKVESARVASDKRAGGDS